MPLWTHTRLQALHHDVTFSTGCYQYIESQPGQTTALDAFLGESDWRQWERARTDSDFTERVLSRFLAKLANLGFQGSRQITVEAHGTPLYRLALFSRHPKADEFWRKITTVDESGQREFNL
jgi:hypothetical protein